MRGIRDSSFATLESSVSISVMPTHLKAVLGECRPDAPGNRQDGSAVAAMMLLGLRYSHHITSFLAILELKPKFTGFFFYHFIQRTMPILNKISNVYYLIFILY